MFLSTKLLVLIVGVAVSLAVGGIALLKRMEKRARQREENRRLALIKLLFETGPTSLDALKDAAQGHLTRGQLERELDLAVRHNEARINADGTHELTPLGEQVYSGNSLEVFDLATDI